MTIDRSKKWAILFAVVATQFAVPFMISSVGISLPSIGREFQASAVALSLVEGVFLCGNAMLLLPLGRAADILGRAGIFLSGLVIFLLGTFTLTLAPTMGVFLLIRGVQSVGGAMTLATVWHCCMTPFRWRSAVAPWASAWPEFFWASRPGRFSVA